MPDDPFYLAVASHKGGTGRTTTALALAHAWGKRGYRVALVDADPARASGLVACDRGGDCSWSNVRYFDGLPDAIADADIAVIDCPPLLDAACVPVLRRSRGVLLTVLADPLSLRTVPAAASVLAEARSHNPKLELLGVLVAIYNGADAIQAPMYSRLREMHGEMLVEPPVPEDPELRDWPLTPGAPPPNSVGGRAFASIAEYVLDLARKTTGAKLAPPARRN